MPLSRMLNSTFAMPNIIDSHDMGLRTVLQSRRPKVNAYSTPIQANQSILRFNSVGSQIFRDGFDSWVVMPTYIAEEVNCDISDTLSDGWDIT
ncbi:hypothetical protein TNCV_729361 [Trichonephila clavipes]|nr:hypothetical protein TNCV_729361 [Trichonephila clavipes]